MPIGSACVSATTKSLSKDTITQEHILIDIAPKNLVRTAVTVTDLDNIDDSLTIYVTSTIDESLTLSTVHDAKVQTSEKKAIAKPEL